MLQRRYVIIAGVVALVAFGGYWLFRPQPVLVETAKVLEQDFTVVIEGDGRTRVHDRYVVSAPLAGRVARSPMRAGDEVKAGQTLLTVTPNISPLLDPRQRQELEERVGSAEAGLEEATATLERYQVMFDQAKTEFERSGKLMRREIVAVAKFERDKYAFQSAEREVAAAERHRHAAEHILKQARAALKSSGTNGPNTGLPVTSPIDGRVFKVIQQNEASVAIGTALLEIGDPKNLEVVIDVLTTDAVLIREGARVEIVRWGGTDILEGRVRRVEPSGFTKISALGVEEQRVWVIVDITSPPETWANLSDGYRVDLKIVVDEIKRATVVPIGALFRRGDAWFVFVFDEGYVRLRHVEGLRRSGRMAAVEKGIGTGETVIVYPSSSLVDGGSVRSE